MVSMGLTPKDKERIAWLMNFKAGARFVEKFRGKGRVEETIASYAVGIQRFCEFTGKDPDQIVNEYMADIKANMFEAFGKWEDLLSDYAGWIRQKLGLTGSSPATMHASAKALINSNVPKTLSLRAEVPEYTSRTIPGVTIEDLRTLDKACDERERVILRFLKDSGMSLDDAVKLTYKDIREDFEKGEQFIYLNVYRGKEKVEYETFVGPNTVEALKVYFTTRQRRGEELTNESPLFATEAGKKPLSYGAIQMILGRLQERTGITVSSHRLRKFFETYLSTEIRHPIWLKYWMGHKVRGKRADIEGRYIIPPTEEQRKAYQAAYHRIDLTPEALTERERRIQLILDQAKLLGVTEDKVKGIQQMLLRRRGFVLPDELLEEVKRAVEKVKANPTQQIIVSEEELTNHLSHGWRLVGVLASGRCVIEKA